MGEVTILTWNLQGSAGVEIDAVAAVIAASAPDVIALQEVQRRQAADLARRLEVSSRWAFKHWPVMSRPEGLAVMTPHRIERSTSVTVTPRLWWSWRRRVIIVARISAPTTSLTVVDVHLSPHGEASRRSIEAHRVLAELGTDDRDSALVVGDLNDGPGEGAHQTFLDAGHRDAWVAANAASPGATNWTAGDRTGRSPTNRLDHVFVPEGWEVVCAAVGEGAAVDSFARWSDHLPLVVTVRQG